MLSAAVFEISHETTDRPTDAQTNTAENPSPATTVCVGNEINKI